MDLVPVLEVALEKTLLEWTRCVMTFKKRKELNRALAEDLDKQWRIVGTNGNGRTCHRGETQKLAEDQMRQVESNGKGRIYHREIYRKTGAKGAGNRGNTITGGTLVVNRRNYTRSSSPCQGFTQGEE